MSNQKLAEAAIAGITDHNTESKPGFCCRFVRQIVEKLYPGKYDGLFAGSAAETGINFQDAGFGVPVSQAGPIQVGDILVKEHGSGSFGHIGIAVSDGATGIKVAENSSTHIGRVMGAKGYRTLAQWGHIDLVVRIPDTTSDATPRGYTLVVGSVEIGTVPVINSVSYAPIRKVCRALGLSLDLDENTGNVIIDGKDFGSKPLILNDMGFLPVRLLASFLGLTVSLDNNTKVIGLNK